MTGEKNIETRNKKKWIKAFAFVLINKNMETGIFGSR